MFPLKQSTAITVPIFVHDESGDAVTGISNAQFTTKRISKNGAAFGAMTVTITEMENGWYSVPIGTGHSDTLGLLSITFDSTAGKQVNLQLRVESKLNADLNDVAATDIVSSGAITTLTGSVVSVDLVDLTTLTTTTTNSTQAEADIAGLNNVAATDIVSSGAITTLAGAVVNVDLVDVTTTTTTTTTNTDMVTEPPTAIENADAMLDRNMATGTDTGDSTTRTPRQALRFLRNKWALVGTTLTVNKEDDATSSWTATVSTDAAADPVTGSNPAGGS